MLDAAILQAMLAEEEPGEPLSWIVANSGRLVREMEYVACKRGVALGDWLDDARVGWDAEAQTYYCDLDSQSMDGVPVRRAMGTKKRPIATFDALCKKIRAEFYGEVPFTFRNTIPRDGEQILATDDDGRVFDPIKCVCGAHHGVWGTRLVGDRHRLDVGVRMTVEGHPEVSIAFTVLGEITSDDDVSEVIDAHMIPVCAGDFAEAIDWARCYLRKRLRPHERMLGAELARQNWVIAGILFAP